MKRIVSSLLSLILLFAALSVVPVSAEDPIRVFLNDQELSFDVPPQIINDRTMVPMRTIFENLGATVSFTESSSTIYAVKEDVEIVLVVNQPEMYVAGQIIELDVAPVIVNDRTLVPLRAISEALLCNVLWNVTNRSVVIASQEDSLTQILAKPKMQVDFSKDDGVMGHMHREIRMLFEREYLPSALYQDTELSKSFFLNNPEALLTSIDKNVWNYCLQGVIYNYLSETLPEFEFMTAEDLYERIGTMSDRYFLKPQHVYDYDTFMLAEQVYCVLINLADISAAATAPKYANCTFSSYVAMLYDGRSDTFAYYLLEQQKDGSYALCSVDANIKHTVHRVMENDKKLFIEALEEMVTQSEQK